jgi:hypothetical protein
MMSTIEVAMITAGQCLLVCAVRYEEYDVLLPGSVETPMSSRQITIPADPDELGRI